MPCFAESNIGHRDEDPNARNGMMTKVWGPAGWLFLHCVTFGYPIDPDQYDQENGLPPGHTRRHYAHFFNEVGRVLPCRYCRDSYLEYIRDLPVERHLYNRDSLVKWLFLIHNKVNDKLGVKYCDAELTKVKQRFETYRAKCKALSKDEKKKNEEKGCLTPADGTPKKCLIEVIKTSQGDVTRRGNAFPNIGNSHKKNCALLVLLFILIVASFGIGYHLGKTIHS